MNDTQRVRIATYTQGSLTALPLVLAEQLGYFRDEGLTVDIEEMASGAKSIQALVGGSADVASAFYELTVQTAAQGQNLTSFASLARFPGYVLIASTASTTKAHKIEDLKGAMVAISSPGSPTDLFFKYVLAQHGMATNASTTVAAGSNAARLAILERGGVSAAVLSDPAASQFLHRHPNAQVLADVRTISGLKQTYGTDAYASAVLTARPEWLQRNPETARRLVRALNRSLDWIHRESLQGITKQTPEKLKGEDAAIFSDALRIAIPSFPLDSHFEAGAVDAVFRVLAVANPEVSLAAVDRSKTYTNEFGTVNELRNSK